MRSRVIKSKFAIFNSANLFFRIVTSFHSLHFSLSFSRASDPSALLIAKFRTVFQKYSINTRVHVWHIGNLGWVVRPPDHPSPKDDVRVVVVLERRLFVVAAAVWLLLLEEAPRLLGLAAVGPRAARRHRARRRTRLPAAVPGAARDGDLPVAVDEQGCQMAKFDPFLSLDCARVEGVGAQSKERKGSNFAA